MSALNVVQALVQLRRLEKEAKEGEVSQKDLADKLGFDDPEKMGCAKSTGMALLHLPLKGSMDLGWVTVVPVLTAFFVFYGLTFAAFGLFVLARAAVWAYDVALIRYGQGQGRAGYNCSTLSTFLGTFPYRGNSWIGPGVAFALDLAFVLPFSGVLGLGSLGLAGHAIQAGAVSHALLTMITRTSLNTVCAVEIAGGADRRVVRGARRGARILRTVAARTWKAIAELVETFREIVTSRDGRKPEPRRREAYQFHCSGTARLGAG